MVPGIFIGAAMALKERDGYWYGDSQADLREELLRYSEKNGYVIHHFADAVCECGNRNLLLLMDELQGVAVRVCPVCEHGHPMGDSEEYLDEAELEQRECLCFEGVFEITVGVSLYEDSEDVRWLYVGCRCVACGCLGCYGDWKNEYIGYRELLDNV